MISIERNLPMSFCTNVGIVCALLFFSKPPMDVPMPQDSEVTIERADSAAVIAELKREVDALRQELKLVRTELSEVVKMLAVVNKKDVVAGITHKRALEIALRHLKVDRVTLGASEAFNVHVTALSLTKARVEELDREEDQLTKYKDAADLPDSFGAYRVSVQQGPRRTSVVYINGDGEGRVVLVKCLLEG